MMNYSKIMFIVIMMLGSLITISSNSWLSAWMGLEINLLAFIPLMSENNNLMSTESSLKYFLTQALASSILIFGMILSMMKYNYMFMIYEMNYTDMIMLSSLLMKSGTAPLHWWFPNVMEGLSWINGLILMTWQKIAPLMMISYILIKPLLIICMLLSTSIGAIGGLNQTSLRKLMAYSSIGHLGWMLMAMMSNESLWMIYFCFYTILSMNVVLMFHMYKLFHINQIFTQFFNSKNLKFMMFMNLLSLGGLPPFLGFIPKWMVIQQLTDMAQYFIITFMMMTTLIMLFYYLRLCYSSFMMNYYEINIYTNMNINHSFHLLMTTSLMSILGLFMISMLYFML
uniref:NADH dehydrogenase subunit 2 n=1 Tax=Dorylomorpha alaskensis TaxID=3058151 RepID=UPI0026E18D71|nr:NADH dehydrogenase subunit 2 [Dorylomorpha alaskensis]WJW73619.1 NADH dehydrogenase subunit 2 [Dorylomorpha alaskensis]